MSLLSHLFEQLLFVVVIAVAGGIAAATVLRRRGLKWTWALFGFPGALLLAGISGRVALGAIGASLLACFLGSSWHRSDLDQGADLAEHARGRLGTLTAVRRRQQWAQIKRDGWVRSGWLTVGRDARGLPVSIPVGYESGSHTLVLGATGARPASAS